jgi:hypothetical protein
MARMRRNNAFNIINTFVIVFIDLFIEFQLMSLIVDNACFTPTFYSEQHVENYYKLYIICIKYVEL